MKTNTGGRWRRILLLSVTSMAASVTMSYGSVMISTGATQNISCSSGVCTPTARKAVLNVNDLASMLASGNVTISSRSVAQDIVVEASLSWTSSSALTLDAYRSLTVNKPIVVAGAGRLTIDSDDGGTSGDLQFFAKGHIEFWDLSSSLVINGNSYALAKNIKQIGSLARHHTPYIALAKKFNAAHYLAVSLTHAPIILEGLGNTISNLTIVDSTFRGDVGLFASIAMVRDLRLVNANVTGTSEDQRVGAIAGDSGTFINCYASGQVSAQGQGSFAGGLTGANAGTLSRTQSAVAVTGSSGIEGAGGLVGVNEGTIDQSYSTGSVSGGDGVMVGGLVGYSTGGAGFGGVISNSYASGNVTGGNNAFVGGLIGTNATNPEENTNPTVSSSYSTGTVSGGSGATIGGLIGTDTAPPAISSTYWDLDTSGISDPSKGAGNVANDPGITGLTTTQFQSGLPSGFSSSIWAEKGSVNGGYPYLTALLGN